jgi:hypothetical protein
LIIDKDPRILKRIGDAFPQGTRKKPLKKWKSLLANGQTKIEIFWSKV